MSQRLVVGDIVVGVISRIDRGLNAAFVTLGGASVRRQSKNDATQATQVMVKLSGRGVSSEKSPPPAVGQRVMVQVTRCFAPYEQKAAKAQFSIAVSVPGARLYRLRLDGARLLSGARTVGAITPWQNALLEDEVAREFYEQLAALAHDEAQALAQKNGYRGLSGKTQLEVMPQRFDEVCQLREKDHRNLMRALLIRAHEIQFAAQQFGDLAQGSGLIDHCDLRNRKAVTEAQQQTPMASTAFAGVLTTQTLVQGQASFHEEHLNSHSRTKLDLPSGGFCVIEHTALGWTIDVNSGLAHKNDPAALAHLVNNEAMQALITYIEQHNLTGIIAIDFLSAHLEQDFMELLREFEVKLQKSRKCQLEPVVLLRLAILARSN